MVVTFKFIPLSAMRTMRHFEVSAPLAAFIPPLSGQSSKGKSYNVTLTLLNTLAIDVTQTLHGVQAMTQIWFLSTWSILSFRDTQQ